jgi:hypothetical protein
MLAYGAFRSPDPHFAIRGTFILRRIAADSRKVELGEKPELRIKTGLLGAMGFDIGAIHASDPRHAAAIRNDLRQRGPPDWLHRAAKAAAADVEEDFGAWRS